MTRWQVVAIVVFVVLMASLPLANNEIERLRAVPQYTNMTNQEFWAQWDRVYRHALVEPCEKAGGTWTCNGISCLCSVVVAVVREKPAGYVEPIENPAYGPAQSTVSALMVYMMVAGLVALVLLIAVPFWVYDERQAKIYERGRLRF